MVNIIKNDKIKIEMDIDIFEKYIYKNPELIGITTYIKDTNGDTLKVIVGRHVIIKE